MRARWTAALPLAAVLAAGAAGRAGAADSVVDCSAFKAGWTAALRRAEPGQPELAFGAPGREGEVRVGNLAGLDARFTCREGKLGHLELRQAAGDPAETGRRLSGAAAAVLVAFDGDLAPDAAAGLVAAMRAEGRPGHDAVSAWGPYEITYAGSPDRARDSFVVDLAEN